MTFKKDGADPVYDPAPAKQTIGFRWVGAAALLFGLIPLPAKERRPYADREYRGKRPQQKRKHRRNMVLVSKRVRRKHRRAA